MPICRRQTFKTVRLRFVISRLGWSYYPLYPAICGENPGPPDWPFWLCAGIRGTPRRLCPWHELSRFPKTVRHPCRAATVRERWLNAWPANAPLRSRLGWGFTFVHFYVAHPVDNPAANLPHNLLIELEGHRYGGDGLRGLAVEKGRLMAPLAHGVQRRLGEPRMHGGVDHLGIERLAGGGDDEAHDDASGDALLFEV